MNKIIKLFWVALISLKENKFRAFLTMLGIIIGTASVILLSSVGKSAESFILGSVSSLGSKLVYIIPGSSAGNIGASIIANDRVKYKDYLALREEEELVANVTPILAVDAVVSYLNKNYKTQVIGTNEEYTRAFNFYPRSDGRFIEPSDVAGVNAVAVLGKNVATELFGEGEVIGKELKIKSQSFRIVGVMEEQGGTAFEDYDSMVFIPITSMRKYVNGVDYVNSLTFNAIGDVEETIEKVRAIVRKKHGIENPEDDLAKDDFSLLSQEQTLSIFGTVAGGLQIFLTLIISISLIVGGIGIMNIMFVAIKQRTREIGLRKAVGARNNDILLQFLIEAVVITFVGGVVGVAFGGVISFLIYLGVMQIQPTWVFVLPIDSVVLSLGFSAFIGVVFGIYPAYRASRQDVIEALRYE